MHRPDIHPPGIHLPARNGPTTHGPTTREATFYGSTRPRSSIATACHARLVVWCLQPADDDDRGQTTAEYVLLILGAATIAILVTSWASATDKVSRLFDRVLNSLTNKVG